MRKSFYYLIGLGIAVIAYILYQSGGNVSGPTTIAGWAKAAGFSGADLVTAVAIAYAESGGNPNAVGDVNLGRSIGLWQINLAAHPEYTEDSLYDPQTNANAAFSIYLAAGNSFSPWTTFKSGTYQNSLQQAQQDTGLTADNSGDSFSVDSEDQSA